MRRVCGDIFIADLEFIKAGLKRTRALEDINTIIEI
jgi:hypothetical protein